MHGGDTAIDIYTRAVSDVYQDLFGAGIYVGKGIYDVDALYAYFQANSPISPAITDRIVRMN